MAALGPGRIFWATFPGGRGQGKTRPMIVLSRRTEIIRTGKVTAVVCSTDFDHPLLDEEVLLESRGDGACLTRLRQPTVAVCNWLWTCDAVGIVGEGLVPTPLLREICAKVGCPFPSER